MGSLTVCNACGNDPQFHPCLCQMISENPDVLASASTESLISARKVDLTSKSIFSGSATPELNPDTSSSHETVCDTLEFKVDPSSSNEPSPPMRTSSDPAFATIDFPNPSVALLMAWTWNGTKKKTLEDFDRLVHEVFLHKDFKVKDLQDFSAAVEYDRVEKVLGSSARPVEEPGETAESLEFADTLCGYPPTHFRRN